MSLIIQILYDNGPKSLPLYGVVCDGGKDGMEFLPLYMRGLKTKLATVFSNLERIQELIKSNDVYINNVMGLLRHINIDVKHDRAIYETFDNYDCHKEGIDGIQKALVAGVERIKQYAGSKKWMAIKGMSSIIYSKIEKRGIVCNGEVLYPKYDMGLYSGRSRTTVFNVQGADSSFDISHPDKEKNILLCFDWVAADIRIAGYLSNDSFINESFNESDPYEALANLINGKGDKLVSRKECKLQFLKSLYTMDVDGPFLNIVKGLGGWVRDRVAEYASGKPLFTIAGMPINGNRKIRSAFNATIQGSVAEALQSTMFAIGVNYADNILTEAHDSIIISCGIKDVEWWVEHGYKFMLTPLKWFLDIDIHFPLRISIGKRWKKYELVRVYR